MYMAEPEAGPEGLLRWSTYKHSQSWLYFDIGQHRFALSQVVVGGERFETAHASYVAVYVIVTLVSIIHMLNQMRLCRRLLFVLGHQKMPKTPRHLKLASSTLP